nr:hypothetical protein [uncultured Halomonas sp.]
MKKIATFLFLILFSNGILAAEWYENGSLHTKSALAWQDATYENKLATSGDLIASLYQNGKLAPEIANRIHDVDDIKGLAEKLVAQLNDAFLPESNPEQNRKIYANQKVGETAAMAMIMMGWIK